MKNAHKDAPKSEAKNFDAIQERAPDRDVTKVDAKTEPKQLSPRADIERKMEANNLWIAEHRDDAAGVYQREVANAELTHKLIDLDTAGREADRTAESLKA